MNENLFSVEKKKKNMNETLIEQVFDRFLLQTQLSRDYFERFTQLLKKNLLENVELKSLIATKISRICFPYHQSNLVTFEYQLRLIRFAFQQQQLLQIEQLKSSSFLIELIHHSLLVYSSLLRHLTLQIGILFYEQIDNNNKQTFDEHFFNEILQLFSSDSNLYVQNTLTQFLAIYLSKHDRYDQIKTLPKTDLFFNILCHFDEHHQQILINQLNIYEHLSDSSIQRIFILKTAKYLVNEQQLITYLNCLLHQSLSDYVYMLFSIISIRYESKQTIEQLAACVKSLFLYIQQTEFEEIDDMESSDSNEKYIELMESICCYLFDNQIEFNDLISMILENLQTFIQNQQSFIYEFDFYSSTIVKVLNENLINEEKSFALLINCLTYLEVDREKTYDKLLIYIQQQPRQTIVYQAFFRFILLCSIDFEGIEPIVDYLLFQHVDTLFQWDKYDCVLQFLIEFIRTKSIYPSWLNIDLFRRIIERFISHTNEYVQANLIELFACLIQCELLSPFDEYLTKNFVELTQNSLGDVVRRALAHAWHVILTKSTVSNRTYRFSFGNEIDEKILKQIILEQIPRLIGDAGYETEMQCLELIRLIRNETNDLNDVLEFLSNDGCSNEIKSQARMILEEKIFKNEKNEILEDEYVSILHWLEHPDEHLVLDCD